MTAARHELLALIDTPSAAAWYARWQGQADLSLSPDQRLAIALNPRAYVGLRQAKQAAVNTLPYFTNDSHARVLRATQRPVAWLREQPWQLDGDAAAQQSFTEAMVFWVRLAISYCLFVIEIGGRAVEAHRPSMLMAPSPKVRTRRYCSYYLEPEDGGLRRLVEAMSAQWGLRSIQLAERPPRWPQAVPAELLGAGRDALFLMEELLRWRHMRHWVQAWTGHRMAASQHVVWYTTDHYALGQLIATLRQAAPSVRFHRLPSPSVCDLRIPRVMMNLWCRRDRALIARVQHHLHEVATAIDREHGLFSYRGISFAGIIADKIRTSISVFMTDLAVWAAELKRLVAGGRKPLACLSVGNRCDDHLLATLCRQAGIPTVFISHGSHVPPQNDLEEIEWGEHGQMFLRAPFSHVALQSPLAEAYLRRFPSPGRQVRTGPLVWGVPINPSRSAAVFATLFRQPYQRGDMRIVVHAGTPKPSNSLRLHVYETPDEYLQSLRDVVQAVESLPRTFLIIKFRPWSELSVADVRACVPLSQHAILSVEEPFRDVLGLADLLVSFSSTTIEEALQNRIPVLLYGGAGRYRHVPASEVIEDGTVPLAAAYHVRSAGRLPYAIEQILAAHQPANGVGRQEVFSPYCYAAEARTPLAEVLHGL